MTGAFHLRKPNWKILFNLFFAFAYYWKALKTNPTQLVAQLATRQAVRMPRRIPRGYIDFKLYGCVYDFCMENLIWFRKPWYKISSEVGPNFNVIVEDYEVRTVYTFVSLA